MYCPNCGLANDNAAKFFSNCGTSFVAQNSGGVRSNAMARNIGIGCLIAIAIFLFVGLSCTRACFGVRRHSYIQRRF